MESLKTLENESHSCVITKRQRNLKKETEFTNLVTQISEFKVQLVSPHGKLKDGHTKSKIAF